jgi:hypothetical protein
MSIINPRDLHQFPTKTLIFFTTAEEIPELVPNSYVYKVSDDISDMIKEMRRFDISTFPVICYDNENLVLASKAFFVFEALEYSVFVLYGNLEMLLDYGLELSKENLGTLKLSEIAMEIDVNKLPNMEPVDSSSLVLVYPPYKTIGNYVDMEEAKDFFLVNEISLLSKPTILSGENASVIGLFFRYLGNTEIKVFLGYWSLREKRSGTLSRPETYYSAAGTVYFDAEEEEKRSEAKSPTASDVKSRFSTGEANHYAQHLMVGKKSVAENKEPPAQVGYQCSCLIA